MYYADTSEWYLMENADFGRVILVFDGEGLSVMVSVGV